MQGNKNQILNRLSGWLGGGLFLLALGAGLAVARNAVGFWDAGADGRRLGKLPVLNQTLIRVRESYYDPGRVMPEKMFARAAEELQRTIPEFRLEKSPDGSARTLLMDRERQVIPGKTGNLLELQNQLSLTLQFIDKHRRERTENAKDLEFRVIRGALSTLDPHTAFLTAKDWEQTRMSTSGHFSGVGLQLGIRDDLPTVIAPIENTPAWRAGIKTGDRIVEVDGQATVNMLLDEVVDLIRGPEGQEVQLGIQRQGIADTLHFKLKRASILVQSVESALLPGPIGYLRLKNFQEKSDRDLRQAMIQLGQSKNLLKGLILDLRSNPGGLLDQAVAVSNLFLLDGQEIVKTVGTNDTVNDIEKASGREAETHLPLVVLIDSGSASASEIVAGALKYNQRAVTIGERSFGKGSVQKIFKLPEDNMLKMTVQEYLTPGNRSIQSFGINPDFETAPAFFSKDLIDLYPGERAGREEEIQGALRRHSKDGDPSRYHLSYFFKAKDKEAEERELLPPPQDNAGRVKRLMEQFEVRLAREVLLAAPAPQREAILEKSAALVSRLAAEEEKKVAQELARQGIDWRLPKTPPKTECPGQPLATLELPTRDQPIAVGQKIKLAVKVKNATACPVYQLRGTIAARKTIFDQREILLGYLPAKGEVKHSVEFDLPEGLPSQENLLVVHFQATAGPAPRDLERAVLIQGKERPVFAYSSQLLDDGEENSHGNGDGLIQSGETFSLRLRITNIGKQKSTQNMATIKNLSGPGIYIKTGRMKFGELAPQESREVAFNVEVQPSYLANTFQLELGIYDTAFRSSLSDKMTLHIWRKTTEVKSLSAAACLKGKSAPFYAAATAEEVPLGQAAAGACFHVDRKAGNFFRALLGERQKVFFLAKDVQLQEAAQNSPADSYRFFPQKQPPLFEQVSIGQSQGGTLPLTLTVKDGTALADLYLFNGNDKIFYESVPEKTAQKTFTLSVPLKAGRNEIVAVARDRNDLVNRYPIVRQNGRDPQSAAEEWSPEE